MFLEELRSEIESGKTAKLSIFSQPGNIPYIFRVGQMQDGSFVWQRARIEQLSSPAKTQQYGTWEELIKAITGMQTRSWGWVSTDEKIEES